MFSVEPGQRVSCLLNPARRGTVVRVLTAWDGSVEIAWDAGRTGPAYLYNLRFEEI